MPFICIKPGCTLYFNLIAQSFSYIVQYDPFILCNTYCDYHFHSRNFIYVLGQYPCGRLGANIAETLNSRSLISAENGNQSHSLNHINTTESSLADPPDVNGTSKPQPTLKNITSFFPTRPTITNATNNEHRIVGGNEATPGEIPWQVGEVMNCVSK